jgi:hypothetical protein
MISLPMPMISLPLPMTGASATGQGRVQGLEVGLLLLVIDNRFGVAAPL